MTPAPPAIVTIRLNTVMPSTCARPVNGTEMPPSAGRHVQHHAAPDSPRTRRHTAAPCRARLQPLRATASCSGMKRRPGRRMAGRNWLERTWQAPVKNGESGVANVHNPEPTRSATNKVSRHHSPTKPPAVCERRFMRDRCVKFPVESPSAMQSKNIRGWYPGWQVGGWTLPEHCAFPCVARWHIAEFIPCLPLRGQRRHCFVIQSAPASHLMHELRATPQTLSPECTSRPDNLQVQVMSAAFSNPVQAFDHRQYHARRMRRDALHHQARHRVAMPAKGGSTLHGRRRLQREWGFVASRPENRSRGVPLQAGFHHHRGGSR